MIGLQTRFNSLKVDLVKNNEDRIHRLLSFVCLVTGTESVKYLPYILFLRSCANDVVDPALRTLVKQFGQCEPGQVETVFDMFLTCMLITCHCMLILIRIIRLK